MPNLRAAVRNVKPAINPPNQVCKDDENLNREIKTVKTSLRIIPGRVGRRPRRHPGSGRSERSAETANDRSECDEQEFHLPGPCAEGFDSV